METTQEETEKPSTSDLSQPCKSNAKQKPTITFTSILNKRKRNTLIVSSDCESTVQLSDDKDDISKVMLKIIHLFTECRWLQEKDSIHYKYFLRRVEALESAKKRAENDKTTDENKCNAEKEVTKKRQRKSRWSNAVEAYVPQDVGLIQYAIQVYGNTDITTEQWKQLEDQRKMRLLFDMIQEKQKYLESSSHAGKEKYEYDSDEDTEGGTWEHKRRQAEMKNTLKWAEILTENSKGRHHLGDFLPSEELEKFMFQWEAIKDKKASLLHESDYENFKLESDNIGYKMLKKLGWSEGECLGTSSEGAVVPVNQNAAGIGNAGLGLKTHELDDGDDEYDAYRKRMMLAYRFRPNPLVNKYMIVMLMTCFFRITQGAHTINYYYSHNCSLVVHIFICWARQCAEGEVKGRWANHAA
ncbi:SURP and G-patch domain-containing protein 1-like protein [Leptotrombidium deliense]|uniref:SURP and G-patch domain-containing protein 1-like protein n=1 Tax=Leptotrombidium deliense TaxID=299467 RepID=A0A443SCY7_9ACAR|nr:SURP and G-patch domain-containing protein 1-like protein [Leptotrombidium deliense]